MRSLLQLSLSCFEFAAQRFSHFHCYLELWVLCVQLAGIRLSQALRAHTFTRTIGPGESVRRVVERRLCRQDQLGLHWFKTSPECGSG